MAVPHLGDIRPLRQHRTRGSRLWAEWCFVRVCIRHMRVRLLLMLVIVSIGELLFWAFADVRPMAGVYLTFRLIFGELPEGLPESPVLQVASFVLPILGLTIIIEGILDFALVLRDRRRFERSWCTMLASSYRDHVVLVGLGRLGFRTFTALRALGHAVVVIEADPNCRFLDEVRRDGSPLLVGDARQDALLHEANVTHARSIIVATDDDLANLEVALDARKIRPDIRVVLRMFDQHMADKVADGFNIQLAMSTSALAAPSFATCAVLPATISSAVVGDQVVAMQRWLVRAGGPLDGISVSDVNRRYRVHVLQHAPPESAPELCPDPDTRLQAGDGVVVQGAIERLETLRDKDARAPVPA